MENLKISNQNPYHRNGRSALKMAANLIEMFRNFRRHDTVAQNTLSFIFYLKILKLFKRLFFNILNDKDQIVTSDYCTLSLDTHLTIVCRINLH